MKKNMQKSKVLRWGLLGLIAFALLFVFSAQSAMAEIKSTDAFYVWDRDTNKFVNSNAGLWLDPEWWVPLIHQISFDKKDYPAACGDTPWAGELTMGLGSVDTTGGAGFQQSQHWTLVHCDRDNDGDFDGDDLSEELLVGEYLYNFIEWKPGGTEVTTDTFRTVDEDEPLSCGTGNCTTELVTTMYINLDNDCDGELDAEIPAGGLCFYAEAQPPDISQPYWDGNLQVRISDGGGDKTVNFQVAGPNAVSLVNFSAQSQDFHWMLYVAGFLMLGVCFVILLIHKRTINILANQEEH